MIDRVHLKVGITHPGLDSTKGMRRRSIAHHWSTIVGQSNYSKKGIGVDFLNTIFVGVQFLLTIFVGVQFLLVLDS